MMLMTMKMMLRMVIENPFYAPCLMSQHDNMGAYMVTLTRGIALDRLAVGRKGHSLSVSLSADGEASVLSNAVAWGSLEDHPQTPHKHLSLAQTLPQQPNPRDSATALALGAKANGVTTRRAGNAGVQRSHSSRTSGCPGELSSISSA